MITLTAFDMIALCAVIIIGLPHGAFDGAVYALLPDKGRAQSLVRFTLLYSLLALIIIGLWLLAPILSLIGFLGLSAYHFGKGDTDGFHGLARLIAIIAHGGLVTVFLPIWHDEAAMRYFAALTFRSPDELGLLSSLLFVGCSLWILSLITYARMAFVNPYYRGRFFEVIALAIVMGALPIIPAFAFYFCAIHSRRHFTALFFATRAVAPHRLWPLAGGLSCASWLAGGIALFLLMQHQSFAISAIQIIFIGLAALTVPHMILVDGYWRPLSIVRFLNKDRRA